MAVFTIDLNDYNVTAYRDEKEVPNQPFLAVAAEQSDLEAAATEWPSATLAAIWNSFAGVTPFSDLRPVKKFTDRKTATTRIWNAIQKLAEGLPAAEPKRAPKAADVAPKTKRSKKDANPKPKATKAPAASDGASKKATVLEMLRAKDGATLTGIMTATGWQAHTVRGFMSTLPAKAGVKIESFKNEAKERAYRIVA